MNAIGIDYQRTLCVICLREGPCSTAKIRSVGDGWRHLIPTAVLGDTQWGSGALLASNPNRLWGKDRLADDPWLDEQGAALFWRGLYRRLYAYLGYMQPTRLNGYHTVVSLPAANYEIAREQISHFCQVVGLRDTTVIPVTDAILCRWMTEQKQAESAESVVAVAAIGDTSSSVRAYRIQYRGARYPGILSASQVVSLPEIGQAWWIQKILTFVKDRTDQPLPPQYELGLRDAAIELGAQLSRVAPTQPIAWAGPLQKNLFTPLQLTRSQCSAWPEVTRFTRTLPFAIRDTVTPVAGRATPDMLLIGGVGAVWPFAKDVAMQQLVSEAKIWQSHTPQEDGAWGAACWPEVADEYADILQQLTGVAETAKLGHVINQSPVTPASPSHDYEEIMRIARRYGNKSQLADNDPQSDVLPSSER
jgi:hypothetical protein